MILLADHTTLRLGGPAREFRLAANEPELIEAVSAADEAGTPVLVLGGGSNMVVSDDGFDGLVVQVAHRGLEFFPAGERTAVRVAAGEPWDAVVAASLAEGLAGLECLSGIPGLAGATPLQNVGAYGVELADVVVGVRAFDRVERAPVLLEPVECGFGYRTSALRRGGRYLVLGVELLLRREAVCAPIRYAELARALGVSVGDRAPTAQVRSTVLQLRASKGMLVDPSDPDSVSAGSFFTNPILAAAQLPAGAPSWPVGGQLSDGLVKTSAAWLIEHAGFCRGYAFGDGRVGLSGKHALAIVNRGGASTSDLIAFARRVRDGVRDRFGITLQPEPTLVGVSL